MTIVKQKFNPPLRICKNRSEEVCSISERLWYAEEGEYDRCCCYGRQ